MEKTVNILLSTGIPKNKTPTKEKKGVRCNEIDERVERIKKKTEKRWE